MSKNKSGDAKGAAETKKKLSGAAAKSAAAKQAREAADRAAKRQTKANKKAAKAQAGAKPESVGKLVGEAADNARDQGLLNEGNETRGENCGEREPYDPAAGFAFQFNIKIAPQITGHEGNDSTPAVTASFSTNLLFNKYPTEEEFMNALARSFGRTRAFLLRPLSRDPQVIQAAGVYGVIAECLDMFGLPRYNPDDRLNVMRFKDGIGAEWLANRTLPGQHFVKQVSAPLVGIGVKLLRLN